MVEDLVGGLFEEDGRLRVADHGLGGGDVDVGVGAVLQQRHRQRVHVVQVGRRARVAHHVHQRQQNVLRPLREAHVRVQSVLQQNHQQLPDERERLPPRNQSINRNQKRAVAW